MPTFCWWEEVSGRSRLMEPGDLVCSLQLVEGLRQKKAKSNMQMQQKREERKRKAWLGTAWRKTKHFLDSHDFSDVNSPKVSWLGFRRSYPLHTAVQEGNWEIVLLLLKFGADRNLRDHHGRLAASYM